MSSMKFTSRNLYDLSGLVAVVTGGGTGIGYMIARGLAENGAKVYIAGRRKEVLDKVVASGSINGTVVALQMDVTDKESILSATRVLEEKEGKLHILVNNAGQVGPMSEFFNQMDAPEHKDAETLGKAMFNESMPGWSDLYSINVFPIFFVTMAFLGLLDNGTKECANTRPGYTASVINVTSISGLMRLAQGSRLAAWQFAYNSAKAAASQLNKMLSTELALKNVPSPGPYESEMTTDVITPEEVDSIGKGVSPVPAKRAGKGEEMAGTAVYLASPAGGYMNGQELVIDGGYLAVNP
ncbi:short-chain dehydrogenase [Desarmillaria tabescens]|uniref:Short-chain dehydrogenase n=1 Tax=Armillaria tabescens TaxID=1929756 RepID=A0AA39NEM3_ARMTA|nr:short-chain dehydrogenase [Desarmillaria tabescens]KAK0464211.1 short-chain dehydrogenase [Desarmillaria tabescens]